MNALYYGDNLDVLRRYVADESVDLVYLDPPFNSGRNYNVLFQKQDGDRSPAQIKVFEDTWRWDQTANKAYWEVEKAGGRPAQTMKAFREFLGTSDILAYLAMMAPRLIELQRVLKPTGGIYLHCDPTASHYLKMLMDGVFGPENFKNEIIWKRTGAHSGSKRWGPVHDVILFYSKSDLCSWNPVFQGYESGYLKKFYRFEDEKGRFRLVTLTGAGVTQAGKSGQPWRGVNPTDAGRHWAVPNKVLVELFGEKCQTWGTQEKLDALDKAGLIYWPKRGKVPCFKRHLDEQAGVPIADVIADINPIGAHAAERLGYPTQKPEALLERIIKASSNEGDLVLDPFCGCGTAIAVAQRLNRSWIGIDITHLAVELIKRRLLDTLDIQANRDYKVIAEPTCLGGARQLAKEDPHQFEAWALGLVGARRPDSGAKGADKGIDGRLYFQESGEKETRQIILSVKAGKPHIGHVRELGFVVGREKAAIGVLLVMWKPTRTMREEAASADPYESAQGTQYPKIQILTVEELLAGKTINMPPACDVRTFGKVPQVKGAE